MNWLAHLYLSGAEVEFRVGNLLPDWVGPWEMVGLPEGFLEISQNGHRARLELDESFRVTPGPDLRRALTVWL